MRSLQQMLCHLVLYVILLNQITHSDAAGLLKNIRLGNPLKGLFQKGSPVRPKNERMPVREKKPEGGEPRPTLEEERARPLSTIRFEKHQDASGKVLGNAANKKRYFFQPEGKPQLDPKHHSLGPKKPVSVKGDVSEVTNPAIKKMLQDVKDEAAVLAEHPQLSSLPEYLKGAWIDSFKAKGDVPMQKSHQEPTPSEDLGKLSEHLKWIWQANLKPKADEQPVQSAPVIPASVVVDSLIAKGDIVVEHLPSSPSQESEATVDNQDDSVGMKDQDEGVAPVIPVEKISMPVEKQDSLSQYVPKDDSDGSNDGTPVYLHPYPLNRKPLGSAYRPKSPTNPDIDDDYDSADDEFDPLDECGLKAADFLTAPPPIAFENVVIDQDLLTVGPLSMKSEHVLGPISPPLSDMSPSSIHISVGTPVTDNEQDAPSDYDADQFESLALGPNVSSRSHSPGSALYPSSEPSSPTPLDGYTSTSSESPEKVPLYSSGKPRPLNGSKKHIPRSRKSSYVPKRRSLNVPAEVYGREREVASETSGLRGKNVAQREQSRAERLDNLKRRKELERQAKIRRNNERHLKACKNREQHSMRHGDNECAACKNAGYRSSDNRDKGPEAGTFITTTAMKNLNKQSPSKSPQRRSHSVPRFSSSGSSTDSTGSTKSKQPRKRPVSTPASK